MKSKLAIPSISWWASQGLPLKTIPVPKKQLKQLSNDEKTIAAIATFPYVKRAVILASVVLAVLIVGILAVVFLNTDAASIGRLGIGFWILIGCVLVGLFVAPKASALLDGFDIIDGSSRLGLPFWFRLIKFLVTAPTMLLGGFGCMLLQLFNRWNQAKMLGLPRIALPQNGDFDSFINYYAKYEQSVNAEAPMQSYANFTLPQVEEKIRECKQAIKDIENDSSMTYSDKSVEISKWKETLAELEKIKIELEKHK